MRRIAALAFAFALLVPSGAFRADENTLVGYSPQAGRTEREWEAKLRAIPSPANLRENMRRLSARPHHVGSAYDQENAEWILARFQEWGWDAHIERFDVLFPTPKVRVLEMVEPVKFTAKLEEPALAVDPTSNQKSEQLPTYNAYSIDGDVTAPLVFVNYGLPQDYEKLERLGVSVKGAIVLAKYSVPGGGSSRRWPRNTEPSAASSIPSRRTTATPGTTFFRRGRCAIPMACSAGA